ncbi:MAG: hypothetical protein ACRDT8_15975, partial [Micromonosporaceae bacterium]
MNALAADDSGGLTEAFVSAITEPERALAELTLPLDNDTLRELVEDPTPLELIQEGLTRKLGASLTDASRTRLYGLRAVTSRLLGR